MSMRSTNKTTVGAPCVGTCKCGTPAKLATVINGKPENVGKKFYTCQQGMCKFFKWDDGSVSALAPATSATADTSPAAQQPATDILVNATTQLQAAHVAIAAALAHIAAQPQPAASVDVVASAEPPAKKTKVTVEPESTTQTHQ